MCNKQSGVTVEEVDQALAGVAASCRFSSPQARAGKVRLNRTEAFGALYSRFDAREAKWFTRLVLKSYSPVVLERDVVCGCYNTLLPQILRLQDDLEAAVTLLRSRKTLHGSDAAALDSHADILRAIKPKLGVKVGRQFWLKGRSIKHSLDLGFGRMSCEKKVDGEYCQVHIDLSKGENCLKIFSKSGKDSTADRSELHQSVFCYRYNGRWSCANDKVGPFCRLFRSVAQLASLPKAAFSRESW